MTEPLRTEDTAARQHIAGWGRNPVVVGSELWSEDLPKISRRSSLSRGLGRSYGDASLPAQPSCTVSCSTLAERLLAFDPETGILRAEAGLSIAELIRIFLPRGWFTPVTPGTRFVTLGGAVAADIHGKNHHLDGCFGRFVRALTLCLADGQVVECGPKTHPELFFATIGGMGLTGHILEVEFEMSRIPSPWLLQESERISNIDDFYTALKLESQDWPFTVGWLDCSSRGRALGRGILYKGRWLEPTAAPNKLPREPRNWSVPFSLPSFTMGRMTTRVVNSAIYHRHARNPQQMVRSPYEFFYPLDAMLNWNRLYGRAGFTQYQCVLPVEAGSQGARQMLETIVDSGAASSLCVIKDCGKEGQGILSFPKPGVSLALDLPMRRWTQELVDRLNERVIDLGGRIYLAKDALTRPEHFRAMEPRLDRFLKVRSQWAGTALPESLLSRRLMGKQQ